MTQILAKVTPPGDKIGDFAQFSTLTQTMENDVQTQRVMFIFDNHVVEHVIDG